MYCFIPQGDTVGNEEIDALNYASYRNRYKDVFCTDSLALKAYRLSHETSAQALLNMAYVAYQKMDFERVDRLLRRVRELSTNQVDLLCADVLQMKSTQRTNQAATFYQAKHDADTRITRIQEELTDLNSFERDMFVYAQSEYHIIASTYYYYQGQDSMSVSEIREVEAMNLLQQDTAQWIYFNYMMGSGGMITSSSAAEIALKEFDYMFRTYTLAHSNAYIYFEANALQSIALMLMHHKNLLGNYRADELRLLQLRMHTDDNESLSNKLCERAIKLFDAYGDLYQTACAYRTMGELHFHHQNHFASLKSYARALRLVNLHHRTYYHSDDTLLMYDNKPQEISTEVNWMIDPKIKTVPDWIAKIRQQICKSYSALGMKVQSDYNWNAYVDLLQHTNQNEELETRTAELAAQANKLRWQGGMVVLLFLLLSILLYLNKKSVTRRIKVLQQRLYAMQTEEYVPEDILHLRDRQEEYSEQLVMSSMKLSKNKHQNIENRARVSMVHAIFPYLDRIAGEVKRMRHEGGATARRKGYILELVDKILQYNDLLTEWIHVQKGQLALRIHTIELGKLFEIIQEGKYAFEQKGVDLKIIPTNLRVKADEALTLFMINTLADNARKFTPRGGCVQIMAKEDNEMVEITVSDTGVGLSETDIETLNCTQVYDPQTIGKNVAGEKGFGFGLANCRGIIEKYKSHAALFAHSSFGVRKNEGGGAVFFFRLPRVINIFVLCFSSALCSFAQENILYDSLYRCNVYGRYASAIHYGSQALSEIDSRLKLKDTTTANAIEIQSFLHQIPMDYHLILSIRNELAISALALKDWECYEYNNAVFTQLRKLLNQDRSLPAYCQRLEAYHRNARLLLVLSIVFFMMVLAALYRLLINRKLLVGKDVKQQIADYHANWLKQEQHSLETLGDQSKRNAYEENRIYVQNQVLSNCLSTIKHESMYYPARIQNLCMNMQDKDISTLDELVRCYRKIYTVLCSQADDQIAQPCFKRQQLSVETVADVFVKEAQRQSITMAHITHPIGSCALVCADAILMEQFAMHILSSLLWKPLALDIRVEEQDMTFLFCLVLHGITINDERCALLFTPESRSFSLYIARQIIREHDTYCGNPGLRLYAEQSHKGLEICFTLLKIKK